MSNDVKTLYIIFYKINGYMKGHDGNKCLTLISIDNN